MNEEPSAEAKSILRKQALLIFILLLITYGYFFQGGNVNYAPQFALIRSVIERQRLDVGGYPTGPDIIFYKGKLYSCKVPGNAILGFVPFYVFFKLLPALKVPTWLMEHLVVYFSTFFTASLLTACTALLLHWIIYKITKDTITAGVISLTYGLATIAFPFATLFYAHQASAFMGFAAFVLLFKMLYTETSPRLSVAILFLSGFLAGYGVITALPNIIIAVFLGIYLLWKMNNKTLIIWYIAGGVLAGAILIAYNILAYKEPFFISYQAYAIAEKSAFPEHRKGFLGITYPRLHLLWKLAFPPQRGLFFYNPVLLAIFPGVLLFWQNKRYRAELLLIIAIIIAHFCFNASYGDTMTSWGGGGTTGPRHLIPMIPFAMILLSPVFQKIKPLFLILLLPSFIFMLIATAVNPVLGFENNPMFQYAIPRFVKGELAVNQYGTFNNIFITKNSVAFNPGKLLGLQGTLSLLPLAILWLILAWGLAANWIRFHLIQPQVRKFLLGSISLILGIVILLPYYFHHYQYKALINPYHSGLIGYYYEGENWEGNPVFIRHDREIDFPWGYKKQPLLPPFSVEWKGYLIIPEDGLYSFILESDDGSQLYISNELIIDNAGVHPALSKLGECNLKKGKHKILIKYFNKVGNSVIRLYWINKSQKEIIPRKYLSSR